MPRHFFFLMIRRPPRSTPFPTRRSSDLRQLPADGLRGERRGEQRPGGRAPERSEEHTSELQSRQYLVCRLLLEKKKTYINYIHTTKRINGQYHFVNPDDNPHQQ